MGVECSVDIVDWEAFVSTFRTEASESDPTDLWFEFIDSPNALRSKSPIHGPCYDNYGYFLGTYEAYSFLRLDLSKDQRNEWDCFFGLLMPSYFNQVRDFTPADALDPFDFEQFRVPGMLQVALDPQSAGKLYSEVWCQLDLVEFKKCADSASELIQANANFRNVAELMLYINAWAEAVEFASNKKMGLTVCVCV